MKNIKAYAAALIMAAIVSGCGVAVQSTPVPIGPSAMARPTADYNMFGPGRMPIPARPPVPNYVGNPGPLAPFADIIGYVTINNMVKYFGEKPLIVTRLWVGGVEAPLTKTVAMHSAKMYDHVFVVHFLPFWGVTRVGVPACQFLDGSGECKVRVVAQAASWRFDLQGHQVASQNVACIEETVTAGIETAVLDWQHKLPSMIACPEQGVATNP